MELSIVLVIIGLVIGGVMVGRDLIRNAEIRTILSEVEQYNTVVNTFKLKFNSLPGDMANAVQIWGLVNPGASASDNYTDTCFANSDNGTIGGLPTCNGNGNGFISGPNVGGSFVAGGLDNESFSFWQHLANAQLVSGGGFVPSESGHSTLTGITPKYLSGWGGNSMSSKTDPKGLFVVYHFCNKTNTLFSTTCGQFITYGKQNATAANNMHDYPLWPILSSAEARSIDDKIDDGRPGTGTVNSVRSDNPYFGGTNSSCSTTNNSATAQYETTSTGPRCGLLFKASF